MPAGLELQQLITLKLLLETRSVTLTAQKLRVSQSAMSHTLRRLRQVFEDELLVRGRGGMVLTPRAEALHEPLLRCLHELEDLMRAPRTFEPSRTQQMFRIGTTDFLALQFAPRLAGLAQREAPGARFEVKPAAYSHYARMLETGDLDVIVGSNLPEHMGLIGRDIGCEEMACAVRSGHPRIQGPIGLPDYVRESHVLVTPAQKDHRGVADQRLDQLGLHRHVAMFVTSFLVAPHIVLGSDLLLTAPRSLLELYAAPFGLAIHPPPIELGTFQVRMRWHERTDGDPAQRWLRQAVVRAYRGDRGATRA